MIDNASLLFSCCPLQTCFLLCPFNPTHHVALHCRRWWCHFFVKHFLGCLSMKGVISHQASLTKILQKMQGKDIPTVSLGLKEKKKKSRFHFFPTYSTVSLGQVMKTWGKKLPKISQHQWLVLCVNLVYGKRR